MRPGDEWGSAATGAPALDGRGSDAALATIVRAHPGALVHFVPSDSCDLARAIGLTARSSASWEAPVDAIDVGDMLAVNMVTMGSRPDRITRWTRTRVVTVLVDDRVLYQGRATSVVVANGQYLSGHDLVPRGHPGDGRLEVQVYALRAGERGPMRRRLALGTHLPHPRITTGSGRRIEVYTEPPPPAEVDGVKVPGRLTWRAEVIPGAFRLLV